MTDVSTHSTRARERLQSQQDYVSATALAQWLDCSRQYLRSIEVQGVIERALQGSALQPTIVRYVKFLRRERTTSPRAEADSALATAKPNCSNFAIAEKRRDLIPRSEVDETLHAIAGIVTTHLAGMAARCTSDLRIRAAIDAVVREVRTEMAIAANK